MLHLHDTTVSSDGVRHALDALSLSTVSLDSSIMSPELAAALSKASVVQLELHGDDAPEALNVIAATSGIQYLTVDSDAVTDDCVPALSKMSGLTYLQLTNTRMTRGGYDETRGALPACEIFLWMNWGGEETD